MTDDVGTICHSYTKARKHPLVIAKFAGFVSPWPMTALQLGVAVGSLVVLVKSMALWGVLVPGILKIVPLVGVPGALWWAVRFLVVEGRPPLRAAVAYSSYLARPKHGWVDGATFRTRPIRVDGGPLFVRER